MSLEDRTNERIPLSINRHGGHLTIDVDQDSSFTPSQWVWLFVPDGPDEETWTKLTYEEAERAHDRLGRILGKVAA